MLDATAFICYPGAASVYLASAGDLQPTEDIMVGNRSRSYQSHRIDAPLDHSQGQFHCHFLPAHCGPYLNSIAGFWRVLQDAIGAGRCFPDLHQLCQRTRQGLVAHQERPIYVLLWQWMPPRTSWALRTGLQFVPQPGPPSPMCASCMLPRSATTPRMNLPIWEHDHYP